MSAVFLRLAFMCQTIYKVAFDLGFFDLLFFYAW